MALDENNNFLVTGASGEGVIATDFSTVENSHFQVVKVAFGNTANEQRVTDSVGLPVNIVQPASLSVTVGAISAGVNVGINGTVSVVGVVGATAIGITASDLDIRALTAGDPTAGLAPGADFVRIVGYSGGYPVTITGTSFDIRGLTWTKDSVSVLNIVGVTATDLDIRGLSAGTDSIRVLGGVTVTNGEGTPWSATAYTQGFQTRLLRATKGADAASGSGALTVGLLTDGSLEDTVRVVGLSGAYPVDVVGIGLTSISDRTTRTPLHVDDTGALYVNLASGSITVNATADVSGLGSVEISTIRGISLAYPVSRVNVIPITGYTGADNVPVTITGANINIRGLSWTSDSVSVFNTVGVTATNFDIRGLTWTKDSVSVLNTVGVTATDLDIRGLTYTSDSVSVLNTVGITATNFDIRSLTAGDPTAANGITTGKASDFVRVIGESGGWPVNSLIHGLTNINNYNTKAPIKVSDAGELYVNLATGGISLTANVTGLSSLSVSVIEGLSLPYPTDRSDVMPVHGYTGTDMVPVSVQGFSGGTPLSITGSINLGSQLLNTRVIGPSGDFIAMTGSAATFFNGLSAAELTNADVLGQGVVSNNIKTLDPWSKEIYNALVNFLSVDLGLVKGNLRNVSALDINQNPYALRCSVVEVSQPTGGTSGTKFIGGPAGSVQVVNSSVILQSGLHLKSALTNAGTLYIGIGLASTDSVFTKGFPLYPGDELFLELNNANRVYASSTTGGLTLHYIGT